MESVSPLELFYHFVIDWYVIFTVFSKIASWLHMICLILDPLVTNYMQNYPQFSFLLSFFLLFKSL